MAENKEDNSKLLADIDSIEVSILIIAKHPNGQAQSKAFLIKRGWPTEVTGSISEAIDLMVKNRPDIVLISFNHPHPSILKLPEVITQTFNVLTVGFVETADAVSVARLAQAKVRHKIQGFPSGPSIQRVVRRALSERLAKHISSTDLAIDLNTGNQDAKKESITSGKYTMVSSKVKRRLKDIDAEIANSSGTKQSNELTESENRELLFQLRKELLAEDDKDLDHDTEQPPESKYQVSAEDLIGHQALLEQAVETSMKEGWPAGEPLGNQEFGQSNRIAVFVVDSPSLLGYLVACPAQPPEPYAEGEFLKSLKDSMSKSFKSLSVPGSLQSSFWIDIPEIDFNEWAKANALFSLKVPYRNQIVAVAYFPTQSRLTLPEKNKKWPEMYNIKLDEISTEVPVNFKAYLPMPKSGKNYLYLRNGRTLQPEQKDRLSGKKINSLCIKGVDIENFKSFMAADYFRNLIKKKAG